MPLRPVNMKRFAQEGKELLTNSNNSIDNHCHRAVTVAGHQPNNSSGSCRHHQQKDFRFSIPYYQQHHKAFPSAVQPSCWAPDETILYSKPVSKVRVIFVRFCLLQLLNNRPSLMLQRFSSQSFFFFSIFPVVPFFTTCSFFIRLCISIHHHDPSTINKKPRSCANDIISDAKPKVWHARV